jgi:trans-aconitate 3-methyltransferase
MAQPDPKPAPFVKEKTFSSYNQEQGKFYAQTRRNYAPNVYQTIIDHHTSTGGQLDSLLDVGCGPGTVAFSLAPHFAHVTGIDPSEGMLATARSFDGVTSAGEKLHFQLSSAEELGGIQDSSVDLITAANAAHWFDMPGFWPSAARVLKPGGTVAIWTSGQIRINPSMPNAAAIQAAIDEHDEHHLRPYYEDGNLIVRNRYEDLVLPWTMEPTVPEFDQSTFFRKNWDFGEQFYLGPAEADLDTFEKMLSTGSATARWRQAHPKDVGTDRDVIKMIRIEIERLLDEAGVEKDKQVIKGYVRGTVLMVKKKT